VRLARATLAAAVAALWLAGCSTRQSALPAPSRPQAVPIPSPGPAVSPATYIAQATSIDLFVIRASELALNRSSNPRLRQFASAMIVAHRGTAAQLSFAGRRLDLLPPAALLPQHQAMLDELSSSGDFDRTYVRLQRAVHGAALSLHADYATSGGSPTLRPVARNAAAIERSHLEMLRGL
jgi:putative membrane protein